MTAFPLGRQEPGDMVHVEKYPLLLGDAMTAAFVVEKRLSYVPSWKRRYNQGTEGACVGFASSEMMSILNRQFYDAFWLYHKAQQQDGIPLPHSGTTVRAAMDVLRDLGHRRIVRGVSRPVNATLGIAANRWATSVDEIRACIKSGVPVVMGTNWYTNFDTPVLKKTGLTKSWWVGQGPLGKTRGGHAWCIIGASDKRQAFLTPNSWGPAYPNVWVPYEVVARLLREGGEATIVTDE